MRKATLLLTIMVLAGFAPLGQADDQSDIEAVIMEYNRTEETNDMAAQAKIMTSDRVWLGTGSAGRRADQAWNMKIQQAQMDRSLKRWPDTKRFFNVRDLIIKVYDDAAVASFYWYRHYVLSPDAEGSNINQRLLVSLFLVKEAGGWKIAHTHVSSFHPSN
jgi:uncharacterized protein (TIGR02246 family)